MIEAVKEDGIGAALMHDSWTSGCSETPYVSYMRFIQRDYIAYLRSTDAFGYAHTAEALMEWRVRWL